MPATPVAKTTRYFRPGITKVVLLSTPAVNLASVTRTEIDAGDDISTNISAVSGFSVTTEQLGTPDWGERFTSQIPGRITAEDSSITSWADEAGEDLRADYVRDQEVDVLFFDGGDVAAQPMDAFRCVIASVAQPRDGDAPATVVHSFSIRQFEEGQAIPAHV